MAKNNQLTAITKADLEYIRQVLLPLNTAPALSALATKLAFKRNASQLSQAVKTYDPNRRYDVGDLICKEYDDPLMVSSKGVEHFKGSVVLAVINKIPYPDYNCAMIEVDYTGGGVFRRHIDYMKKTKTQVLLPCSLENGAPEPELMEKDHDPRLNELPITEKDLRTLEKSLRAALLKSEAFFNWRDHWQLTEKQVAVTEKTVEAISKRLRKTGHSISTTQLVTEFLKTPADHEKFPLHCLSLNHLLDKKYKKTFLFSCPTESGQWALKETLLGMLKSNPLASPTLPLPESVAERKPAPMSAPSFPLRIYLSWREILSGGIQIPSNLVRELSRCREYKFHNTEIRDEFPVFFYPTRGIFLGLAEYYKKHRVTQGASLTLDKVEPGRIQFTLKISKKAVTVPQVSYDPKQKRFLSAGEVNTSCHPNKILYLRSETLEKLFALHEASRGLDLRELLILVFKSFGLEGEALSLYYERAFHMADILKHTTLESVEKTLIGSPEFAHSEKKRGLFLYQEKIKTEEEISPEDLEEIGPEIAAPVDGDMPHREDEDLPAIGTVGEIESPTVVLEETVTIAEPPAEEEPASEPPAAEETEAQPEPEPEPEPVVPAPVEKPSLPPEALEPGAKGTEASKKSKDVKKKKRIKPETERMPRRGKGEKRIIEERIELEESELEAQFAVKIAGKVDEDIKVDKLGKDEQVFIKPQESAAAPLGGIFGEKLKSALNRKIDEKKPEKKKKPAPAKAKPATAKTKPAKTKPAPAKTKAASEKTKD